MKTQLTIALMASIGAFAAASFEATAAEKPKLILAITIDGLRGDIRSGLPSASARAAFAT